MKPSTSSSATRQPPCEYERREQRIDVAEFIEIANAMKANPARLFSAALPEGTVDYPTRALAGPTWGSDANLQRDALP